MAGVSRAGPRFEGEDEGAAIYAFLARQRFGVVSSVSERGTPESALVGIAVTADLEILFDTLTTSRKYGNLRRCPSCSFVIGWSGEQTVQLEGIAEEPRGAELERYRELYFKTWPDCVAHLQWPSLTYFVVRPHWLRHSDYDQSPPWIEEIAM